MVGKDWVVGKNWVVGKDSLLYALLENNDGHCSGDVYPKFI